MSGTELLRLMTKAQEQLDRLLRQLQDLDEAQKEKSIDPEEYRYAREDTLEQLQEFENSLAKMHLGEMELLDSVATMRLAIRAAVSTAFKTPEVIRMFASKQPDALRQVLFGLDRDFKLGKLPEPEFKARKVEVLGALVKLGEVLSDGDQTFLASSDLGSALSQFIEVDLDSPAISHPEKVLADHIKFQ